MKAERRLATTRDMMHVIQNLSPVTKTEIQLANVSPAEIAEDAINAIRAGNAYVGTLDNEPVLLFWFNTDNTPFVTSFMAAKKYFKHYRTSVRQTRKALKEVSRERGDAEFLSYTRSPHRQTSRWFKQLGMEQIAPDLYVFRGA